MFLKRQMPVIIAISVGLFILFGHFINIAPVQQFVNNDATQWFDIIASFAIFLGALNMLKLQVLKVVKKQRYWQYFRQINTTTMAIAWTIYGFKLVKRHLLGRYHSRSSGI